MKVSLNWIKKFTQVDLEIPELIDKIGSQLGAVEANENLGEKYKGAIVVKVVSCVDHPNADKLHVCMIDDGGKVENIERDNNGHIQVVCGAPNVREGLMVVWLPPGVTVPSTFNKDPFIMESREIRGIKSNGMLASPKELAIGDLHEGILEVDKEATPGVSFADTYELNDTIIDIENKMFTHRPDCFGQLGIAREVSGILGQSFKSPDWYLNQLEDVLNKDSEELPLEVKNELPDLVPRFMAIALSNINVKPSPIQMQSYLSRVGVRPINNVVDITNYIMLLTGQPLHAYDYDKVRKLDNNGSATLTVRFPHEGEKLTLLNGKQIEPRKEAIMIATASKLIGLGGVMGGADTEVDESTHNIILEVATFDMYSIRRTSMAHGIFSDAVTRFNKGQSPFQNGRVMAEAVNKLRELANAKVAGPLIDNSHTQAVEPVGVSSKFINDRLGLDINVSEMKQLLEYVEFSVENNDDRLAINAPFWRTDIHIPEDVVEEIGRLYGFDKLPLNLPLRSLKPVHENELLSLKSRLRDVLSQSGANEVLTYSFVHGNLMDKVGQDQQQAFKLTNALSPDLQYYRLSLTPSLLEKVHNNVKAGYDQFAMFEIGKVHNKTIPEHEGLPREINALGFVFAADDKIAKQKYSGAPYYQARKFLDNLLANLNVMNFVTFEALNSANLSDDNESLQLVQPFEPNRAAVLRDFEGQVCGVVGEFKSSVTKSLKLPTFTAGFEIDPLLFTQNNREKNKQYVALPRFPKVEQDICLKVPISVTYNDLFKFVWSEFSKVQPLNSLPLLSPVDIYQKEDDPDHKQITFRFKIASYDKTMKDSEVAKLLDIVAQAAKEKFGAERI